MSRSALDAIFGAIEERGGTIKEVSGPLPDGSGFFTASMPLPKNHWLYEPNCKPPMPFRRGTDDPSREEWAAKITEAAKYAIRGATMSGKDMDFDPDALIQNLIVGMLGYWTTDGLSFSGLHTDGELRAK